ncbi:MAG: hypothetical protein JW854_07030 [Actinobacteria bacterium]|nr:hypothetical protein [Actinomycetota bacterium]
MIRKILFSVLVILLVFPIVAGCGGASSVTNTAEHETMSYSLQGESPDFGFGLFQQVASMDYNTNIVLSPLSAKLALAMASNGAIGETKEAMAKVLDLEDMSLDEINKQLGNLMTSLEQADEAVLLEIANSLWADEKNQLAPDFEQRCRENYDAEVANLDFTDPASVERINGWVNDKTHGKIDRIVDKLENERGMLDLIL